MFTHNSTYETGTQKEKETGTTNSGRMMDHSNKWYCKWLSV